MANKKIDNNLFDYVFLTIEDDKEAAKYILKNMFADFIDKDEFMKKFKLNSLEEVKDYIFSGEHNYDIVLYGYRQYDRYHADYFRYNNYCNNAIKYSKNRKKSDY